MMTKYYSLLADSLDVCCETLKKFPDLIPKQSWGSMKNQEDRDKWGSNKCDDIVGGSSKTNCQGTINCKQYIT